MTNGNGRTKLIRLLVGACMLLGLCAGSLEAQTATPASKLGWDQVGQTVTVAQGATYNVYVDGATVAAVLGSVTCAAGTGTAPTSCQAAFPALTPGTHTVTLSQVINTAESGKSTALSVTFVVVVTPTGIRIIP